MTAEMRLQAARWFCERGAAILRLAGKRPVQTGWSQNPPASIDAVEAWAQAGNIGLRCDLWDVIDIDDGADPARLRELGLDTLVTVRQHTGTPGAMHIFVQKIPGATNGVECLGAHIDLRTVGGQVVLHGSVHPDTKRTYQFVEGCAPWEVEIAPPPAAVVECIAKASQPPPERVRATVPAGPREKTKAKWAETALRRECQAVCGAAEGTRNDTLNTAAFNLGQLVPQFLSEQDVVDELRQAARTCGLTDSEADATIASGVTKGMQSPRTPPAPGDRQRLNTRPDADTGIPDAPLPQILIPGAHVDGSGRPLQQGTASFVDEVIDALPRDLVFRNANVPGIVWGSPAQFVPLGPEQARMIIDRNAWLFGRKPGKDGEIRDEYHPASADHGKLLVEGLRFSPHVSRLVRIVRSPCLAGPDWNLIHDGYNEDCGLWYDEPEILRGIQPHPNPDIGVFHDLLCDFSFKDHDRGVEDCVAQMLTAIFLPVIIGPVPATVITSPMQGTGKTLLARTLGAVLYGPGMPVTILPRDETEKEKKITAFFACGKSIVFFDNVAGHIDSPALNALLTGTDYEGRILGASQVGAWENRMLVIMTGNNLSMTGELARRCIQIRLQTTMANPHLRGGFRHRDPVAYALANRRMLIEHLLGLAWAFRCNREVAPPAGVRMGSYDAWVETVIRCCRLNNMNLAMTGFAESVSETDDAAGDLGLFGAAWMTNYGGTVVNTKQALDLATGACVYGDVVDRAKSDQGRLVVFGRHLKRLCGMPFQLKDAEGNPGMTVAITRTGSGNASLWRLEQVGE